MNMHHVNLKEHRPYNGMGGFTLVELMLVVAIVGVLASIAAPLYKDYTERIKVNQAIEDISVMAFKIKAYQLESGEYPDALGDVLLAGMRDPWGNSYRYLNLDKNGNGGARRDKNLNPLNTDFDLYSVGKNGSTRLPISQIDSLDDILRANDGNFLDLASEY
jgi:general secretion pathway protein G